MTAEQNLKLVCRIKGVDHSKIIEKLEIVGLLDRKDHKFKTYSLGMKQRLAIASALLNDPEILILDEPTNGLDPQGIHEIREIIKNIASNGTTILLASHLLDEVEKVCSHVVIIREGVKLYSGRVDEMTASYGLLELKIDKKENELIKQISLLFKRKKTPLKTVYKSAKKKTSSVKNTSITQKQIDAILDKISKSGYDTLTKAEKDFLFRQGKK